MLKTLVQLELEQLAMTIKHSVAPRMNELGMLAAGQLQVPGPGPKVTGMSTLHPETGQCPEHSCDALQMPWLEEEPSR